MLFACSFLLLLCLWMGGCFVFSFFYVALFVFFCNHLTEEKIAGCFG